MQPSTTSTPSWGPTTMLHWIAVVLGVVPTVSAVTFMVYAAINALIGNGTPLSATFWTYVLSSLLAVALLVATFWPGVGEVVGGLALIGGAFWLGSSGAWEWGSLIGAVMYAVAGILFIACSEDTLPYRRARTPQTPA